MRTTGLAVLAAALLIAGCGGGDNGSDPSQTRTTSTTVAAPLTVPTTAEAEQYAAIVDGSIDGCGGAIGPDCAKALAALQEWDSRLTTAFPKTRAEIRSLIAEVQRCATPLAETARFRCTLSFGMSALGQEPKGTGIMWEWHSDLGTGK